MRLCAARILAKDRYSRPLPETDDPGVFSVAVFLRSSRGKCPVTAHYSADKVPCPRSLTNDLRLVDTRIAPGREARRGLA